MAFDPHTEIKYLANGKSLWDLPYSLRAATCLAYDSPRNRPPSNWQQSAIARYLNLKFETSGAAERLNYVQHCHRRMQAGIPVDVGFIQVESNRLTQLGRELACSLPPSLILNGKVNTQVLKQLLPANVFREWPRKNQTELCFSNQTLLNVNHDLTRLILAFRQVVAGRIITKLPVDSDGAHRYWAAPFCSATSRDNPVGLCMLYVPARYRERLINPPRGQVLVQLDYQQQEPLIAASLANDTASIIEYGNGDFYQQFRITTATRAQTKKQVCSYLYGKQLSTQSTDEIELVRLLNDRFAKINSYLDEVTRSAFSEKNIRSYDWQMAVPPTSKILSIRNWKVQATGASILRKACLLLDKNKLPVNAAFHDAVLLQLPLHNLNQSIQNAIDLMQQASVSILKNAELRVSIEAIYQRGINHER